MKIVGFVLRHPYTVVAVLIMICLLAVGAASRMPIDIFPEINIPVVSVVWTYNGMSAPDIQNRILSLHERSLASLVDDISRIEATSYQGVGVEKIYLHEGADVSRAVSQLASSALVVLKYMPPNITPPLVLRYDATDVPIIQLSLSSTSLPDTRLNDLGQNIIRPDLAIVHGAEVPQPYGGKPRVIMADLDQRALSAHGLSLADVSEALQRQNVILPSGDVKIGAKDYTLTMNNSPDVIDRINAFPIKEVDGRTVFMRDIAHVHDGFQVQTNSVAVDGRPGALITIRKTGGVSTLAVIDGIRKRAARNREGDPQERLGEGPLRPVAIRQGGPEQRQDGRHDGRGPDCPHDPAVPRQLASCAHYSGGDPALHRHRGARAVCRGTDAQHHDPRRVRVGDRDPGR